MPKNLWIKIGVLLVVASALLWVGAQLTKRIEWFLPYAGCAGIVLLIVGVALELRNQKMSAGAESSGAGQ